MDDCCYNRRNYPDASATMRKKESGSLQILLFLLPHYEETGGSVLTSRTCPACCLAPSTGLEKDCNWPREGQVLPVGGSRLLLLPAGLLNLFLLVSASQRRLQHLPSAPLKRSHSVWVGLKTCLAPSDSVSQLFSVMPPPGDRIAFFAPPLAPGGLF